VLRKIISEYTREAGLRELERQVARVARKVARKRVERDEQEGGKSKRRGGNVAVTAADVTTYLGPPRFLPDEKRGSDEVGLANG
jgi:ATP-dependent Lon protease